MGVPQLSVLAAPPVTLQQAPPVLQPNQMTSALPNVQAAPPAPGGVGGFLHGLLSAFQANPQTQANAPLNAPGIAGLFPEGSGAQSVIGRLWDAHLMHEGQSPIFQQWQQNAAMGQAEQPLLQNGAFDAQGNITPEAHQSLAALAKINPEAAQQMQGNLIQSQIARMNMQREINMSQADIAAKNAETQDKARGAARALLSSANAQNYPIIKERAEAILTKNGVDPAELSLPKQWDPDQIRQIQLGSVPVQRQIQLEEQNRFHTGELQNQAETAHARTMQGQAALANVGNNGARAGAAVKQANTAAQRLQDEQPGGPLYRPPGGSHHVFGGAAAPVAPPPFAPGRVGRTVTNGTHTFFSPDGKTWVAR